MRTALLLTALLLIAATAEAAHVAGHYGGVPAVQPAPLPWQPRPTYQPPVYGTPPPAYQPHRHTPAPRIYVPQLPQSDPRAAERYRDLNVCRELRCD